MGSFVLIDEIFFGGLIFILKKYFLLIFLFLFVFVVLPVNFAEDNTLEGGVVVPPIGGPDITPTKVIKSLDENFTTNVMSNETNNGVEINNTYSTVVNHGFINASNLTKCYGENQTFQGFVNLTGVDEVYLTNIEIEILITRLSTGASKWYHIPVNFDGYFEIPINLAPGNYHVVIPRSFYIGGNISGSNLLKDPVPFYNIFILNPNANQTQTFLDYDENSFVYGFKGQKLVGTLKTQDDNFLSNQIVEIEITRNSNGASKTYFVTTNINGEYNLPINLAEEGSYTFRCTYRGTDKYTGSNCMLREYCELPL